MSEWPAEWTRAVRDSLLAPFPDSEVEFLPKGGSFLAYIDARCVMNRLDEVVGPCGWDWTYEPISASAVRGILTVLGRTRCDAGEAANEQEPLKSAVSDALKRCAVHFGVGRYLYYLPSCRERHLDRAAVARALQAVGYLGSAAPPESRGDQRANAPAATPVKPSSPARVEEAVRSNEQAETFAGAAGAKAHDPRGAWHGVVDRHWKPAAERTEEGQRLRHAIAALLAGKSAPFESMTGWDERKWSALAERAQAHEEQCADEVCRIMTGARAMMNAQLEATGHAR